MGMGRGAKKIKILNATRRFPPWFAESAKALASAVVIRGT
jgi:hypothetical protein